MSHCRYNFKLISMQENKVSWLWMPFMKYRNSLVEKWKNYLCA